MKVVIGSQTYDSLSNLSFAPQTDLKGTQIPVNEFFVDIQTEDPISEGTDVILIDDMEDPNIWAAYWITKAEKLSDDVVRICAQSKIALLDRKELPAVMYEDEPLVTVMRTIFASFPQIDYRVDVVFSGATISGFCPKQTARDRLLWVCFVLRAYVMTFFSDTINILSINGGSVEVPDDDPIDLNTVTLNIPIEKTYWKPSVTTEDCVTKVTLVSYEFTQGSPSASDEWVSADGSTYYIVHKTEYSVSPQSVPQSAPPNEVVIDGVMLVNEDNVNDILSYLGSYYFSREKISAKVINNADYEPGNKVRLFLDEDTIVEGFIESCTFHFGLQAASDIKMIGIESVASGNLIVIYKHGTMKLGSKKYAFPVGFVYSIQNPYVDLSMNQHRYIYRPVNEAATGAIAAGSNVNTQMYEVALDLDQTTKILHIISVDSVEEQESGDYWIAVIDGDISGSSSGSGTSGGSGSESGSGTGTGSEGGSGASGETGSGTSGGESGSGTSGSGTEGTGTSSGGNTSGSGSNTGGSSSGGSQSGTGSQSTALGSLGITTLPRQVYNESTGYDFTTSGMVVKYTSGNGIVTDVTSSCITDPEEGDLIAIPDDKTVFTFPATVYYTVDGVTYNTSYTVTVYAPE